MKNCWADSRKNRPIVLVGTQMISKGLDFEDVTLVVVLNADQGLRFPDYRSYEKTFSTVSQVSGRAGRGEQNGRVIVQTIEKDNEIFTYIKEHDYEGLYENEIRIRKTFKYPPIWNDYKNCSKQYRYGQSW